ncbi:MAG: hypothetical protein NVV66_18535 [Cellulomonas sp.]|uniref:hypothetical protein n=1 Tax=Cellulomonas sp. TaxID=40001 RepID=UPI00258550EC|nr:hypothetical protein [Cellulomonas sp.]MCR6703141.1 hypothetical protein [Cellulomonas sp.]MCR6706595.1 hypothetical protein [Cellulomonas sp.]
MSGPVSNDFTTGRLSRCVACGREIEEALLLKGLRVRPKGGGPSVPSPGIPRWRTLDRGPSSARCASTADGQHQPGTGAEGTAFQR